MSSALRRLSLPRHLSSSSLHLSFSATASQPLDFHDHERLFASVPTRSLLAALANLYLMACGPLVDVGAAAVKGAMERGWARGPVAAGLKRTVYGHFCAGESVEEAAATLRGLWEGGLRGILDYGFEDAVGDEECDRNLEAFVRTVEIAARLPPQSVSFACVKITALCPISLLERVSLHLRHSSHLPWLLPSLPITARSSISSSPLPLSHSDQQQLHAALSRLSTLCTTCQNLNLPLLVDAEYSSVQPAIDHLTYAAMLLFNHHTGSDRPLVYGTVQAYLRDSMERLMAVVGEAERRGVPVGFKLVRGAYLSRERREAAARGVDSPVHGSIAETHESYDRCAAFLLEKVAKGSAAAVLATHNVDSGKKAAAKVEELGINKSDARVEFAQLKGMSEALSLGLKNAGFNVSKYLAFGPVEEVVPYLLRRAEENRGVLSASTHDRILMRRELMRRLKVATCVR